MSPPGVDVSIVIVNYNAIRMLERTLETLFNSRPASSLEVIVVDNASTDGSTAMVRERFSTIRWLSNHRNVGYASANNQGIRLATGRHVLLLNNDTIIRPGAVDALVEYLDAHPRVGAVGPKVLNVDGSIQGTIKNPPTPAAALFGRNSVLTRLFPRNAFSRRYLLYREQDYTRPFAAGSVSTCALLVRRTAIERAGPMDERFFVYWSDVDWCRAIWAAGFEVWCAPQAVIVHDEHKGGTSPGRRRTWGAIRDFHRGAYVYYRKWHVRRAWHPNHIAAVVGLATRAVLVLATEYAYWSVRERRRTA
jgi:N-acetylglucosaminyl-diphospho-decaprenol L-rhamnosyltransferase